MSKRSSSRQPLRLLAVLMGIVLLIWLVVRTGASTVFEHARAVGWGMVLILVLGGLSHLLRAWAWRLTFRTDVRGITLARMFALRLISEAIGTFGLAGQMVGDTLRVSLLGPRVPIADRISSVALDRGLYIVAAAVLSVAGMLASVLLLPLPHVWRVYALLFAAGFGTVLLFLLVGFGRQWRLASKATSLMQRLPWARQWLADKVSVIESAEENLLGFYSRSRRRFWGANLLYATSQALAIAEVYFLLLFMGVNVGVLGALVIEAFTKLISIVGAVNPGNIGTFEGGNLVLARLLGFSGAAGLTLALCRRARVFFWAAVGGLCLIAYSRGKEQNEPEPVNPGSENAAEREAPGEKTGAEQDGQPAPAVIIVVESRADGDSFQALVRIGELPVLLRAILSAEMLHPSRMLVFVPASNAQLLMENLDRTGRVPRSVEWRELASGAGLASAIAAVAGTADRVVLLSGTTTYKPDLLQRIAEWEPANDALVFQTGTESAGIIGLSQSAAVRAASSHIDTLADLHEWTIANCESRIVPAPCEEWQVIATPEDRAVAEHKMDGWLMKPTDGMFARFNRKISIPISRQLIKTPITPNMVSFIVLGVSVASGFFFSRGGYWNMMLGALLSLWASILDGCDGEVARLRFQSSRFGCWLDTICDYLYYLLVFGGITWGLKRSSGSNAYVVWGAVLVVGTILSFLVVSWLRSRVAGDRPDRFLARWQSDTEKRSSNPLLFLARQTEFIIRRCFFPYALLVAALLNITKGVFLLTAIGANLVWSIALYSALSLSRKQTSSPCVDARVQTEAGIRVS